MKCPTCKNPVEKAHKSKYGPRHVQWFDCKTCQTEWISVHGGALFSLDDLDKIKNTEQEET
jgi:transposase-like protein